MLLLGFFMILVGTTIVSVANPSAIAKLVTTMVVAPWASVFEERGVQLVTVRIFAVGKKQ